MTFKRTLLSVLLLLAMQSSQAAPMESCQQQYDCLTFDISSTCTQAGQRTVCLNWGDITKSNCTKSIIDTVSHMCIGLEGLQQQNWPSISQTQPGCQNVTGGSVAYFGVKDGSECSTPKSFPSPSLTLTCTGPQNVCDGNNVKECLWSVNVPSCQSSPPPTILSPPPTILSPPPTILSPPPTILSPPPTILSPPPTILSPPPTILSPPPTILSPPPTILSPPPTILSPPPTILSPPPTILSPPNILLKSPPPPDPSLSLPPAFPQPPPPKAPKFAGQPPSFPNIPTPPSPAPPKPPKAPKFAGQPPSFPLFPSPPHPPNPRPPKPPRAPKFVAPLNPAQAPPPPKQTKKPTPAPYNPGNFPYCKCIKEPISTSNFRIINETIKTTKLTSAICFTIIRPSQTQCKNKCCFTQIYKLELASNPACKPFYEHSTIDNSNNAPQYDISNKKGTIRIYPPQQTTYPITICLHFKNTTQTSTNQCLIIPLVSLFEPTKRCCTTGILTS